MVIFVSIQKQELFLGLRNVKTLIVAFSSLGALPGHTFQNFSRLQQLVLPDNGIHSWPAAVFRHARPLRMLILSSNSIQTVSQDSLPPAFRSQLEHVDLSGNPFYCNASLAWFAAWLADLHDNASVTLKGYPEGYVCSGPPDREGRTLADAFSARASARATVEFIALAAGVALFIGAGLCLLRWRSKLGNCCLSRGRRSYTQLP